MEEFRFPNNSLGILLEKINVDLRTGVFDEALVEFIRPFRQSIRSQTRFEMGLFWEHYRHFSEDSREKTHDRLKTIPTKKEYPNREILELIGRLGLDSQLFVYSSRFAELHPEGMALACECIQVTPFDLLLNVDLGRPSGLRPNDKLNSFRLAQRIRNEYGITRRNSPSGCFNSFEDIIGLEKKIEANDAVDFMVQCLRLKLVDIRHKQYMYLQTSTYSQLHTFHDAVKQSGPWHWYGPVQLYGPLVYRMQFAGISKKCGREPTLQELKKYLRNLQSIVIRDGFIFDRNVPDGEMNEFLNCLLNNLARTSRIGIFGSETSNVVGCIAGLLRRGATLYFRDPDEERTSLGALVKFANSRFDEFPLMQFSEHFCCHLSEAGPRISFDNSRLASLFCLAARAVPLRVNDSQLPDGLRPFIEAHQELQSQFRGGISRPDCFSN